MLTVPPVHPPLLPPEGCSSAKCACTSSINVEFYDANKPEPRCTARPAVYRVRFVSTWTKTCHPTYYFSTAHWSPATGISHKPEYELWDACMRDVSLGVALMSQTGQTGKSRLRDSLSKIVFWAYIRRSLSTLRKTREPLGKFSSGFLRFHCAKHTL